MPRITKLTTSPLTNLGRDKKFYLIVLLLGLLLLFAFKKSWFVAATVDGQPITNLELLARLNKQFREQTLTEMINEKILFNEARKKGVVITPPELDKQITDIENRLGGKDALDNILSSQGQNRVTLREQLKLQLTIEKLFAQEATVSAVEIDDYLVQNAQTLQATNAASQRKEAEDNLVRQKISQAFNDKFQKLREQADIKIF